MSTEPAGRSRPFRIAAVSGRGTVWTMTRFYLDTEFLETGPAAPVELISLALVTDDDRTLYLVNADFDRARASDWLRENVLPHLDRDGAPSPVPYSQFGPRITEFVADVCAGAKPEFWMWSGAYDFVLLNGCFGRMVDTPPGWPNHFNDLRAWAGRLGNVTVQRTQPHEHDALYDARHDRDAYQFLAATAKARAAKAERRLRERLLADVTAVLRAPTAPAGARKLPEPARSSGPDVQRS